jgi:molybdenum cofactor cytidylyltransferase
MPVAAIILAAGASSRLGQPKQLLMLNGQTLLARAELFAAAAGASPVITVLGAHSTKIASALPPQGAVRVFNERWEQGIASSIHTGLDTLESLAPDIQGALIMTCDQPRLSVDHLRALLAAFESEAEHSIAASFYVSAPGVPAIFPRSVIPHLRTLSGDRGARALLANPPGPVVTVPFAGGEIDIDVPADLASLE